MPIAPAALPSAQEEAFARNVRAIYRFVYGQVGNKEDAEDLTSRVFLRAARWSRSRRVESDVLSSLFTVARRVLADYWQPYHQHEATLWLDNNRVPTTQDRAEPYHRSTTDMLGTLPQQYQRTLELCLVRGLSVEDTSHELGVSVGEVTFLQYRALKCLALESEQQRDPLLQTRGVQ
jgi:RNA polymerase sigma-70 factor (ECF subfamily)